MFFLSQGACLVVFARPQRIGGDGAIYVDKVSLAEPAPILEFIEPLRVAERDRLANSALAAAEAATQHFADDLAGLIERVARTGSRADRKALPSSS